MHPFFVWSARPVGHEAFHHGRISQGAGIAEAEVGAVYTGTVARIVDFGAFINILPGKDGLVHISQIANERVENVSDFLKEGQQVQVKVMDVDQRGRIKLSIKELLEDDGHAEGVAVAEDAE